MSWLNRANVPSHWTLFAMQVLHGLDPHIALPSHSMFRSRQESQVCRFLSSMLSTMIDSVDLPLLFSCDFEMR